MDNRIALSQFSTVVFEISDTDYGIALSLFGTFVEISDTDNEIADNCDRGGMGTKSFLQRFYPMIGFQSMAFSLHMHLKV